MEPLIRQKSLDVPDPKQCVPAPFLFVPNENGLETGVGDARKAPEENPGHCLLQAEDISTISTDTAHLSQGTITADEPAHLKIYT